MSDNITPGQVSSLRTGLKSVAGKDRDAHLYMVQRILGRSLQNLHDLTRADWKRIKDEIYPAWTEDDWTISPEFTLELATLYEDYRTHILSQLRLF